ncbi:hypothetical protein GQ600_8054 [Phytophthora cactorum]|nr:hypothetical protein GQ600_8054 [Phytophthora cactorum]
MVGLPNDDIKFSVPSRGEGRQVCGQQRGQHPGHEGHARGGVQAQRASGDPEAADGQGERRHRHGAKGTVRYRVVLEN